MPVQALNFQISSACKPVLKETYTKPQSLCYHDLLMLQDQCPKKQIDHFLQFVKMASSENLPPALDVLENKSLENTKPTREIFDQEGRTIQYISSDGTINYQISYNGNITTVTNQVTGEVHLQEMDDQGRLIREVFPCGLEISWKFDDNLLSEVTLPDQSKVSYQYVDQDRVSIQRISSNGEVQYQHIYNAINDNLTKETLIGKAGVLQRQYDEASEMLVSQSNHLGVVDQYDENQDLISRTFEDPREQDSANIMHYPVGNLLSAEQRQLDDQGRVVNYNGYTCSYDEKGRLIQKASSDQIVNYAYDAFGRLTSVKMRDRKVEYTYDLLGRRFSKILTQNGETHKEFYLYQGVNQIGVYNEAKEPIHQRVLGVHFHTHLPFAIAIESKGKVYAPIYSSNYNILQLVDKETQEVVHYESLNPFGENLQNLNPICPWIFATKYFDSDTGLVDFGDRQYDPSIKQWTSADSDPRASEEDLYSYCNNNPLKYIDPNGQIAFLVFIPLTLGWKAALIALGIGAAAAGTKAAANHTAKKIDNKNLALAIGGVGSWAAGAAINKIKNMPFPDRELPRDDKTNEPLPDTNDPHTQLGQRQGRKEKYPQAREFDENGQPVRDIDFTDHDRPDNHPLPHQHPYKDNPSGGTKQRGKKAEPVPEWNYEED